MGAGNIREMRGGYYLMNFLFRFVVDSSSLVSRQCPIDKKKALRLNRKGLIFLEPVKGFEPSTRALQVRRSTN